MTPTVVYLAEGELLADTATGTSAAGWYVERDGEHHGPVASKALAECFAAALASNQARSS
jgi:hypothetical protein